MSDLQTMVRRIRTDINRGSSHDARIKEAIVDAIKRFRSRRLGFNQKKSETVLLSDQEIIALPTDRIEADFLRLEVGSDRWPLREVAYDTIEEKQRGIANTGLPRDYAIHNRELRFYPIPDQSYTLVFSFQYDLGGVSVSASDAATNAWLDEGEELIRKQATGDLMISYIGGDKKQDGAMLLAEVEGVILPTLESRAAREQTSGMVRPFL
jgi:hypothetical protein